MADVLTEIVSARIPETAAEERAEKHPLGPLKLVHAFWLAGMSCDGCPIAAVGATNPSVESLLSGTLPGIPEFVLHYSVLTVEAGEEFVANYQRAEKGELGAPYVVIYEGSVPDERIANETGGYWSSLGVEDLGKDEAGYDRKRPI